MDELQLVIKSPEQGNFLRHIEWNKEEFEGRIDEILANYEGLTYTEEQIAEAKNDKATLNAIKKAVSDRRIQIKKMIMVPYDEFEADVRTITQKVDEAVGRINAQLDAYEEKRKAELLQQIKEYFEQVVGDLKPEISLEVVFEDKYLNKSFGLKKVKAEIDEKLKQIREEMAAIDNLPDQQRPAARNTYLRTFNLATALEEARRQEEIRLKIEEERRKAEEQKKAAEQANENQQEVDAHEEQRENKHEEHAEENPGTGADRLEQAADQGAASAGESPEVPKGQDEERKFRATFALNVSLGEMAALLQEMKNRGIAGKMHVQELQIYGTRMNLLKLRDYMDDAGINYGTSR